MEPEAALASAGIPEVSDYSDSGENDEGEYSTRRSLTDRLGDWLEYRIAVGRDRMEAEAPYREAVVAQKVARLQAKTDRELGLMGQQNILREAQVKAQTDLAAAKGKSGAGAPKSRKSSAGMGADKGRGKPSSGSGAASRGAGAKGSGGTGPGGKSSGRNSGSTNPSKGSTKGPDRSAARRNGAAKGKEAAGGPKGRQNGSGGSGGSSKGGNKGDGAGKNKKQNANATSPAAERSRGRQDRAAARQAARLQRRSDSHAADLANRTKARDQALDRKQTKRDNRDTLKAERAAAKKAKREAAAAVDPDRTTWGAAVAKEAQRRWDERRAAEKAAESSHPKLDLSKDKDDEEASGKAPEDNTDTEAKTGGRDKSAGTKDKGTPKDGDEPRADAKKDDSPIKEPGSSKQEAEESSGGTGGTDPKDASAPGSRTTKGAREGPADEDPRRGAFRERVKEHFRKSQDGRKTKTTSEEPPGTRRFEDFGITVDRSDRPEQTASASDADEPDYPDAIIVEPKGLHPASEPPIHGSATIRVTQQESNVSNTEVKSASGQGGLAAQHRTDITFDEYLIEVANIALTAERLKDRAEALAEALGRVADALRDMATDLVGDHNIDTRVTDLIANLADAAGRMKMQAERVAQECEIAADACRIAAAFVARVYGEDMKAMEEAGLTYASAAAHHD
ncbi:ATP/GTP-binding protein (plasmid) [Streptomyces sp. NBC_01724]|uniref:ATP/GTP-binding protein n=1 Tax=Streptomyces sp. NBC_01724 TaxID=2975922 RepID=UPI002E328E32|nr:ATP/GTP-binding protein [Streptomyces sp. NBC_01724]